MLFERVDLKYQTLLLGIARDGMLFEIASRDLFRFHQLEISPSEYEREMRILFVNKDWTWPSSRQQWKEHFLRHPTLSHPHT